jgi:hypothetical protein
MMPVTIRTGRGENDVLRTDTGPVEIKTTLVPGRKVTVSPDEFENFGRLRMNVHQIAAFYGITSKHARTYYDKPQFRAAYERGRAEIVMAVRQKQLKMALDGDRQMLLHAGAHFGELGDPKDAATGPVDTEDARSPYTWGTTIADRCVQTRNGLAKRG